MYLVFAAILLLVPLVHFNFARQCDGIDNNAKLLILHARRQQLSPAEDEKGLSSQSILSV
jgi:hypothetical protein